jgi:hypothetical protein
MSVLDTVGETVPWFKNVRDRVVDCHGFSKTGCDLHIEHCFASNMPQNVSARGPLL